MGPHPPHHVHAWFQHLLACQSYLLLLQIVSQADASGEIVVKSLASVQGQSFDRPTVLITEEVGGMEDIPVSSARNPASNPILYHAVPDLGGHCLTDTSMDSSSSERSRSLALMTFLQARAGIVSLAALQAGLLR